MIVFQRKIILSNLNFEMKFHTGAHFTKQCGGNCLILMSLKWLRLIRTFQQALHHSSPPWQSVLISHWLTQHLGKFRKALPSPTSTQCPWAVLFYSTLILFHAPPPPPLPLDGYRLEPTSCQFVCSLQQQLHLQSLETNLHMVRKIEVATREQSVSVEWHRVRRDRLTSSRFREICHVRGQSSAEHLSEWIRKGVAQTALMKRGLALESARNCKVTPWNWNSSTATTGRSKASSWLQEWSGVTL